MRITKVKGPPNTKEVLLGANRLTLYSIGYLVMFTQLGPSTLRLWEREETLPKPVVRVNGQARWYTSQELLLYTKAITDHYMTDRDKVALRQRLAKLHQQLIKLYGNGAKATLAPELCALSMTPAAVMGAAQSVRVA